MKSEARAAARRLRADEGLALSVIAQRLGVAKSSVSRWVRDIDLTPQQHVALAMRNPLYNSQLRGQHTRRDAARLTRLRAQTHGRALARRGDALHLHGCMLYWAEGSKSRNAVSLTNSDPDLPAVFLRFLRASCGVADERISLFVNCHVTNGLDADEIVRWWLSRLGLPDACRRAPTVNRVSSASRRLRGHVLPYGTARLTVYSTDLVQSIYGAIQEYAGCERPEWLD